MGAGLFGSMGSFDSAAPERSPARPPDPPSVTESSLGPRFALWQLMGMEGKTLAILVVVPTHKSRCWMSHRIDIACLRIPIVLGLACLRLSQRLWLVPLLP